MSNLAAAGRTLKMTGDSSAEVRVQLAIQLSGLFRDPMLIKGRAGSVESR